MPKQSSARVARIGGAWLARDGNGWRVRVPVQGGHQYFPANEYGGNLSRALSAARAFQTKALRQLEADRKYAEKHGERPRRETLNIRNRSGYAGLHREVYPLLDGQPTIAWVATAMKNGRQIRARFSTAKYTTEQEAFDAARKWRQQHKKR